MHRCLWLIVLFLVNSTYLFAQKEEISYELNGRPSYEVLKDSAAIKTNNPFRRFIGEWTLKEDSWTQNWGYGDETIEIPKHHTISSQVNTENSILSIVDGPEPNGHIFWTYNPNTKEVSHLSSFGDIRIGKGGGQVNDKGDVTLKLSFEGETKGTYRRYAYTWLNQDEYHMKSTQYSHDDKVTGLFYEGTFTRIIGRSKPTITEEVEKILSVLDDHKLPVEEQILVYADDVIHMAPNSETIKNRKELSDYLTVQRKYGYSEMKHRIIEIEDIGDVILMRGGVVGTFHPSDGGAAFPFRTKNLFVFKRIGGELKISKVIYNHSPEK